MHTYVSVIGHLTRDIELRYTPSGLAIGNTGIASTHKYSVNGEKREETCFIDVAFMSKSPEIANQYLQKCSKVFIDGRLKFDQQTDNNEQSKSKQIQMKYQQCQTIILATLYKNKIQTLS